MTRLLQNPDPTQSHGCNLPRPRPVHPAYILQNHEWTRLWATVGRGSRTCCNHQPLQRRLQVQVWIDLAMPRPARTRLAEAATIPHAGDRPAFQERHYTSSVRRQRGPVSVQLLQGRKMPMQQWSFRNQAGPMLGNIQELQPLSYRGAAARPPVCTVPKHSWDSGAAP